MNAAEKPSAWWTYENFPTRWAIVVFFGIAWLLTIVLLFSDFARVLATRPWWEDLIVAIAGVAVPILAWLELRHSAVANTLRDDANRERRRANILSEENAELAAELDAERNKQLAQIAANTRRVVSPAERNAEILRRHIGACLSVTEGQGAWPTAPLVVEVNEANIATLFAPSVGSNPQAWCIQVDCGELEIAEIPQGACPLRARVLRRYGPLVPLGEITRWEDRNLPAAAPIFNRGGNAHYLLFSRQGEARSLYVYTSADGSNSFLLEASTGERIVADNVEISKRFVLLAIDYLASGFSRGNSGTSGSPHRLYIPMF